MPATKITAIIQARMGSTRLPGKVLAELAGCSMLARVVRRVRRATLIGEVVVATTESPDDQPIVDECRRLDAVCFRGNEDDVLDRYYQAAMSRPMDVIVRITSDCPLIDPEVTDQVVQAFLNEEPDYAANILQRTWPRGLDTEVMTQETLTRAWGNAREPYERIHVTPYIYRHPEQFRLLSVTGREDHSNGRWTVDSPADLDLVRAVYQRLGGDDRFSWHDVERLFHQEPSLADLNRHVRQKQLVEG